MIEFVFWKKASPIVKRLIIITVFFIISVVVTLAGTLTPLSAEEANNITKDVNQTFDVMRNLPAMNQATMIFGNNLFICLLAFVPIVGTFLAFYILYNTGVVIAALTYGQSNPSATFLQLLAMPFGWMEFLAYSIGISGGLWLLWRIIKRQGKSEIANACKCIAICAVILLGAAFIEAAIVAAAG